jgi:hypothetical protein
MNGQYFNVPLNDVVPMNEVVAVADLQEETVVHEATFSPKTESLTALLSREESELFRTRGWAGI